MFNRRMVLLAGVVAAIVLALIGLNQAGPALMDALIKMHHVH